jgi:hypothetical protein
LLKSGAHLDLDDVVPFYDLRIEGTHSFTAAISVQARSAVVHRTGERIPRLRKEPARRRRYKSCARFRAMRRPARGVVRGAKCALQRQEQIARPRPNYGRARDDGVKARANERAGVTTLHANHSGHGSAPTTPCEKSRRDAGATKARADCSSAAAEATANAKATQPRVAVSGGGRSRGTWRSRRR